VWAFPYSQDRRQLRKSLIQKAGLGDSVSGAPLALAAILLEDLYELINLFDRTHRTGERRLPPLPEIHQPGGEPADLTDRHLRSGSADSIDRGPLLRHLFGLGFGILLLELGFLLAYRAGWNLSTAALASNVTVALVLLPIGLLAFREQLNAWNWMGVVLALAAIVLIGKK